MKKLISFVLTAVLAIMVSCSSKTASAINDLNEQVAKIETFVNANTVNGRISAANKEQLEKMCADFETLMNKYNDGVLKNINVDDLDAKEKAAFNTLTTKVQTLTMQIQGLEVQ